MERQKRPMERQKRPIILGLVNKNKTNNVANILQVQKIKYLAIAFTGRFERFVVLGSLHPDIPSFNKSVVEVVRSFI